MLCCLCSNVHTYVAQHVFPAGPEGFFANLTKASVKALLESPLRVLSRQLCNKTWTNPLKQKTKPFPSKLNVCVFDLIDLTHHTGL